MRPLVFKMLLMGAAMMTGPTIIAKGATPILPPSTLDLNDFEYVREKGSVKLYERWYEVEGGEKVRELKAEFSVDVDSESMLKLLKNTSRASNWMQRLDEFELVDNRGGSWVNYVHYNIPWPLDDQDVVLRYRKSNVDGALLVTFVSDSHDSYPSKRGITRMQGVSGSWLFQPTDGDETRVTYKITTRNKSSFPRWIIDPLVQDNLLDTMNAFCAQAKELHAQR